MRRPKKENRFQSDLIKELHEMYPDAIILKNDANYIQGIPDITILAGDRWALLESKRGVSASKRPNQDYYIDKANNMSFARFINPKNKEEVLHELQQAFET